MYVALNVNAPITAFRSRSEPYTRFLKKRTNGRLNTINQNDILLKKGDLLIGWVNERNIISPLYDETNSWVVFDLGDHVTIDVTYMELQDLGVFQNFRGAVRERSRSPPHRPN